MTDKPAACPPYDFSQALQINIGSTGALSLFPYTAFFGQSWATSMPPNINAQPM